MPSWDDAAQRKLLLAVIQLTAPAPPKWDQVAAIMGEGYTAGSVQKQYSRMKTSTILPEGMTSPKKTPAKRGGKKEGEGGATATPKSESKRKAKKVDDDDDDEEVDESPMKKVKAEKESSGDGEEDEV